MYDQITPPDGSGGSSANAQLDAEVQRLLRLAKTYRPPAPVTTLPAKPAVSGNVQVDAQRLSNFQQLTVAWLASHTNQEQAAKDALTQTMLQFPAEVRSQATNQTNAMLDLGGLWQGNAWKPLAVIVGGGLLVALIVDLLSLSRR